MGGPGIHTHFGHPSSVLEKPKEIDICSDSLDIVNRGQVMSRNHGPFAHLAEVLNSMSSTQPRVLMPERRHDFEMGNGRANELDLTTVGKADVHARRLSKAQRPELSTEMESKQDNHGGCKVSELRADGEGNINGSHKQGSSKELHWNDRNDYKIKEDLGLQGRVGLCNQQNKDEFLFIKEADMGPLAFSSLPSLKALNKSDENEGVTNLLSVTSNTEAMHQVKVKNAALPQVLNQALDYSVDILKKQELSYGYHEKDTWEYGLSGFGEFLPNLLGRSFNAYSKVQNKVGAKLSPSHAADSIPLSASRFTVSPRPSKLLLRKLPLSNNGKFSQRRSRVAWPGYNTVTKRTDLYSEAEAEKQRVKEKNRELEGGKGRSRIIKQLLCGGFAGVISRTAVAPLDLIKTHLITAHAMRGVHKSAMAICQDIVKQDGWQGLFRGNAVNCIRVAPSKAIELCVFEMVRRSLNKEGHPFQKLAAMIAGGAAGIAGTIATYPLELIRTRISVQPELYKGLRQAISRIAREEGVGRFYSGLSPSLVGVFPYAATNYFVYDGLRTLYRRTTGRQNVPTVSTLLFGAVAAAASSAVTYPLEVARRQMQLYATGGVLVPKTTIGIIQEIYSQEGFLALYRGLGTTWLKLVPAAGISFVCYEAARLALHVDDASLNKMEVSSEMENEDSL